VLQLVGGGARAPPRGSTTNPKQPERRRRDDQIEIDRLELIGAERGAILAFHRRDTWKVADIEIRRAMYHALEIQDDRITKINDYAERAEALAAAGIGAGS
jgi:hypothetical protein